MRTASATTALDIVLAYHRAWTSGDVDQAMAYLSGDIVCRAPGGGMTGKEAWRAYLTGFVPYLTGLSDVTNFAAGDHVALFYFPQTAATSTALAAEHFTVRDGAIVELMLVFDRLSYAPPSRR